LKKRMETLALQASVEEAIKQYESRLRKAKL
jgi:predicted component of type VI protein secretion system